MKSKRQIYDEAYQACLATIKPGMPEEFKAMCKTMHEKLIIDLENKGE